ncbi:MAG: ATP-binding protein, partial [Mollicutes bacterium]|nr:ATP-binding protein [Mollicutes bacterium]
KFVSWRGIAFENVCLNHIKQIKVALGISGVSTNQSVLHIQGNENTSGKQIDLIIERKDDVVNVCEIKYYGDVFSVDKKYYETLLSRVNYVTSLISKKSVVQNTLITTFGLKKNEYSGIFSKSICLDDLFN